MTKTLNLSSRAIKGPGRGRKFGDRALQLLQYLADRQASGMYPASIREMSQAAKLSPKATSTSVINYYLETLEQFEYVTRDRKISRGVRVTAEGMAFAGHAPATFEEEVAVVCPHCAHEFMPSVAARVRAAKASRVKEKSKRSDIAVAA